MSHDPLPVKAFLEKVEKRLSRFTKEELTSILREMAVDISPGERGPFLKRLQPGRGKRDVLKQKLNTDDLLLDIEELIHEIKDMTRKGGDYDFYEDRYDYEGGWDDEDSLGPYEDFVDPLTDLVDRTNGVFDSGTYQLAREAYEMLFTIFHLEDDYGRGVSPSDLSSVDWPRTDTRYLRAVYETVPLPERPQALLEAWSRIRGHTWKQPPGMNDLLTVTRRKLPDREEFLEAWIKYLRPKKEKEADQLLREAVRLQGGATSLADLARREGTKRPRAYLDWVAFLVEDKQYREALEAAQEALDQLPSHLPLRASIADHLCTAARKLKLTDKEQQGRWEAFAAWPSLPRLLDLREVTLPDHRPKILTRAATHLEKYLKKEERRTYRIRDLEEDFGNERGYISPLVLGHAYLFNRDWEQARALADRQGSLGWTYSDNPQRLVMPAFLVLILGPKTTLPTFVNDLWKRALEPDPFSFLPSDEEREPRRLKEAYEELRKQTQLTEAEETALLTWCLKTAKHRAEAIVEGQHRRSYDKAAAVLAACVEVCRARQEEDQGNALVRKLRERFPRHRAFQQELDLAMGKIGLPW